MILPMMKELLEQLGYENDKRVVKPGFEFICHVDCNGNVIVTLRHVNSINTFTEAVSPPAFRSLEELGKQIRDLEDQAIELATTQGWY